jgi:DNA (cytosine-5)-methyltransferase 1
MPPIPIIDLFAGPGGLGEGFSAFTNDEGRRAFRIGLSVEKEAHAHRTLELRAFFRQFPAGKAPDDYYNYLAGELSREDLFAAHPAEARHAAHEAWHATLGDTAFPAGVVDDRIRKALDGEQSWVLIGGPPCQAYSLVGRSRIIGGKGAEEYESDHRHFLYREYLRIIAVHRPPVFVMENVKGLLSAKVGGGSMISRILGDLQHPLEACFGPAARRQHEPLAYRLFSLSVFPNAEIGAFDPGEFIVCAEDFGVPQARHRLIIVGIADHFPGTPRLLRPQVRANIEDVLSDLPKLRSGLSKEPDSANAWCRVLLNIPDSAWFHSPKVDDAVRREIRAQLRELDATLDRGADILPRARRVIHRHREWFEDNRLSGVSNHATRSHIRADLHRYFFAAAFARVHNRSPLLDDMPPQLLPKHKNVAEALKDTKFNDRFRVQLKGRPATTVVSHISRDGHYFIHYDPTQCRSLTVREAARLQTFPDNYFFEGPRTQQYHQVGNAVPPLLACQIAGIVHDLFP